MQGRHPSIVVRPLIDEKVPAGQGRHERALVCPVKLLNDPARHGKHDIAPLMLEYEPEPHGVHAVAPEPENVPGGHARHVPLEFAPMALEKVPAAHREQELGLAIAVVSAEYVPGGQP